MTTNDQQEITPKNTKSTASQWETTFTSTSDSTMTDTCITVKQNPDLRSTTPRQSPPHYYLGTYKGLEAFDVCMDFCRGSYNIGVAVAYLLRAGKKPNNPPEQDIRKAIDHLLKELEYIEYDNRSRTGTEPAQDDKP